MVNFAPLASFAVQDFFTAKSAKYAKNLFNTKLFYSFDSPKAETQIGFCQVFGGFGSYE